jgi:hypothetical protein
MVYKWFGEGEKGGLTMLGRNHNLYYSKNKHQINQFCGNQSIHRKTTAGKAESRLL